MVFVVGTAITDNALSRFPPIWAKMARVKLDVAWLTYRSRHENNNDDFGAPMSWLTMPVLPAIILMRMKDEDDDIINTNLTSVFRMIKRCCGMMKAKTGRIINISSVVALQVTQAG
jgi:NAD(P)-dependent dehydrogenase (short-subunit alcohol dehydrogenase family)